MRSKLILALLLLAATFPVYAQVISAGKEGNVPVYFGAGFSRYSPDWGPGARIDGFDAYGGYTFYHLPKVLAGLGFEGDARVHDFLGKSANPNSNVPTTASIGGGLNYRYMGLNHYRPYAKYLMEAGQLSYSHIPCNCTGGPDKVYDLVQIMGGGVEVQMYKHLWARGDFSYESWSNLFGLQKSLTPAGVTVSVSYEFMRRHAAR